MKRTILINNIRALASAMTAALALSSCVKDTLYNTYHPDHGMISVTADWSARGSGVAVPSVWTVTMGAYSGSETGTTHAPDHLFDPGTYTLAAWNPVDRITVSGTAATVESADAPGFAGGAGSFIAGDPGWLMTSVQEAAIEKDRDHSFTASMVQQVRELTIVIEPTGDAAGLVAGIDAYLTGVAGSLDFATDTYGSTSCVELEFTQIAEGADAGKWTATVRLLGIAGAEQRLAGTVRFADGNPLDMALDSDLSSALTGFNSGKSVPLSIGGTMETPTRAGFTADIVDWTEIDNGSIDIH